MFRADLEKVVDIHRMFEDVEKRLGSIYGLVNNAARFRRLNALEITEADKTFFDALPELAPQPRR